MTDVKLDENFKMTDAERIEIKELLKAGKVQFSFTKVDGTLSEITGTLSEITGTLNEALLPVKEVVEVDPNAPPKKARVPNPELLSMYSTDREDWRSIKFDLINFYKVVE
jgi:hypothetical protein